MTIIFWDKAKEENVKVEDVKFFSAECKCLGVCGFDVHYKDGTFNLYDKKKYQLEFVKE